jgi:endogenous inhibitor of DNA gyrase (YacG/DUF329 family)
MYIPKRYGQSRINNCPFCGKIAVAKNKQSIPVCLAHKDDMLNDLKCVCGEYLDVLEGKWGPYFRCMNCGNINFKKALDMNQDIKSKTNSSKSQYESKDESGKINKYSKSQNQEKKKEPRKEITVTSDQIDYMY